MTMMNTQSELEQPARGRHDGRSHHAKVCALERFRAAACLASPTSPTSPGETSGDSSMIGRLILGDLRLALPYVDRESIDFAYIDPPFFVGRDQHAKLARGGARDNSKRATKATTTMRAYGDRWDDRRQYLDFLGELIDLLHARLTQRGVIAIHTDHRAAPYVRLLLDERFGYDRFVNELIWRYGLGNARAQRYFARKHDNIAVYAKSADYFFKVMRGDVTPAQRKKYSHRDELGAYMLSYGRKYYLKGGKPLDSVLNIPTMSATDRGRTGYPTQKPQRLLEVLIESLCPPGGAVLDACCGSGTTAVAAEALGRRWIGVDAQPLAIHISRKRLCAAGAEFDVDRIGSSAAVSDRACASAAAALAVNFAGDEAVNDADAGDGDDAWAIGTIDAVDGALHVERWAARDRRTGELPSPYGSAAQLACRSATTNGASGRQRILRRWRLDGTWRDSTL